jgi:hypothetical protein
VLSSRSAHGPKHAVPPSDCGIGDVIVAFSSMLLPVQNCFYGLQPTIPQTTRSSFIVGSSSMAPGTCRKWNARL